MIHFGWESLECDGPIRYNADPLDVGNVKKTAIDFAKEWTGLKTGWFWSKQPCFFVANYQKTRKCTLSCFWRKHGAWWNFNIYIWIGGFAFSLANKMPGALMFDGYWKRIPSRDRIQRDETRSGVLLVIWFIVRKFYICILLYIIIIYYYYRNFSIMFPHFILYARPNSKENGALIHQLHWICSLVVLYSAEYSRYERLS